MKLLKNIWYTWSAINDALTPAALKRDKELENAMVEYWQRQFQKKN